MNINLENEFVAPVVPPHQSFTHQTQRIPGNMLPAGQNQTLNADLIGLAADNSPSLINPVMNMPQTVHGYQHSAQSKPVGLTGDWQYGAQHSIAITGNQQFGMLPSSHFTNPKQHNRSSNLLPAHHQSNTVMNEAHPAKMSGTSTFFAGSIAQSEELILRPSNSQPPIRLLTGQEMHSIETTNRSHAEHYQSTSNGNSLPPWMTDPNRIPPLYKQVLKVTATNNSFADTTLLYPIFLSSELPKDILGHIWTVANQSTPGKLTFTEVYTALALIALAQNGEMDLSIRYVLKLQSAPVPKIQLPRDNSFSFGQPVGGIEVTPKHKNIDASNEAIGSLNQFLDFDSMKNSEPSNAEAFADFQSFTASEPSMQNQIQYKSVNDNFGDLPSFQSSVAERKAVVFPHYPDRDLIKLSLIHI